MDKKKTRNLRIGAYITVGIVAVGLIAGIPEKVVEAVKTGEALVNTATLPVVKNGKAESLKDAHPQLQHSVKMINEFEKISAGYNPDGIWTDYSQHVDFLAEKDGVLSANVGTKVFFKNNDDLRFALQEIAALSYKEGYKLIQPPSSIEESVGKDHRDPSTVDYAVAIEEALAEYENNGFVLPEGSRGWELLTLGPTERPSWVTEEQDNGQRPMNSFYIDELGAISYLTINAYIDWEENTLKLSYEGIAVLSEKALHFKDMPDSYTPLTYNNWFTENEGKWCSVEPNYISGHWATVDGKQYCLSDDLYAGTKFY